jgi:tRNA-(MS[2]IO[6]A)-hydroxylase (MiaE)-like
VTGLHDLLALLAYGQLQAFDRMAADARLAPDLRRRAALSEMAAAELVSYRRLFARLTEAAGGSDAAYASLVPFADALDAYHEQTEPKDWLEALTKAYVGNAIADDFYEEVARSLAGPDQDLIIDVLHDDAYGRFAAGEIRAAIEADPQVANRLSMWARRLVGEAMSQAVRVAEDRPALVALVGPDDPADLFRRITAAHTARMSAVGLNN